MTDTPDTQPQITGPDAGRMLGHISRKLNTERAAHEEHRQQLADALGQRDTLDWPALLGSVRAGQQALENLRDEATDEHDRHEGTRLDLAAALGGLDASTPWAELIRRAGQVLAGRHRMADRATAIGADRDRLAVELAAARAENDGWAETVGNTDRLTTQQLTETRQRLTAAEAALARVREICADPNHSNFIPAPRIRTALGDPQPGEGEGEGEGERCVHLREGGCCTGPGYCCHMCEPLVREQAAEALLRGAPPEVHVHVTVTPAQVEAAVRRIVATDRTRPGDVLR